MPIKLPLVNPKISVDGLYLLKGADSLSLWSKPNLDFINAYAPGSLGGQGLVLTILKSDNEEIANALDSGFGAWIEVMVCNDGGQLFYAMLESEEDREKEKQERELKLREANINFLKEISSPYAPRAKAKGRIKTLGEKSFENGQQFHLVRFAFTHYEEKGRGAARFNGHDFNQIVEPYHSGGEFEVKLIRASMSGYSVVATVVSAKAKPSWVANPYPKVSSQYSAEVSVEFLKNEDICELENPSVYLENPVELPLARDTASLIEPRTQSGVVKDSISEEVTAESEDLNIAAQSVEQRISNKKSSDINYGYLLVFLAGLMVIFIYVLK